MRPQALNSVTAVSEAEWITLTGTADIDSDHRYLRFREHLEPGENLLITTRTTEGLRGAAHGAMSTPASGLASNPWKLLGAPTALRLKEDDAEGAALRREHFAVALAAADRRSLDRDESIWEALTRGLGPCFTVRGFDRSELILPPGVDGGERERTSAALVSAIQHEAVLCGAGSVVFPFVAPDERVLRGVLAECGFRSGVVTGVSQFTTKGCTSYDDYLARLTSRRRSRYRHEEQELRDSSLSLAEVRLHDHVERIASLEAQTVAKHGGRPDPAIIARSRALMARLMPDEVNVPAVADDDGNLIACGLHLLGGRSVLAMAYGCDYGVDERSMSYPWTCFYHPIRSAVRNGLESVRLGFEAFEAKVIRGAEIEVRETWVWLPNSAALNRLGSLLEFLHGRNTEYFAGLVG